MSQDRRLILLLIGNFVLLTLRVEAWSSIANAKLCLKHQRTTRLTISFDDNLEENGADDKPSDWTIKAPSPDIDAITVATTCARALQWVDYPIKNAGLERCFPFFSWECRKLVTARRGGDTMESFIEHGVLSPALQPFMGAYRVDIGEGTYTPSHPPLRGALASFPIGIQQAPIFAVNYMSGMERPGVAAPPETHMVMRLEQQRRPPLQGCWLVREVLDVRHAFAGDMGNAGVGG